LVWNLIENLIDEKSQKKELSIEGLIKNIIAQDLLKNSEECINIMKIFSLIDDDNSGFINKEKLIKSIFFFKFLVFLLIYFFFLVCQ